MSHFAGMMRTILALVIVAALPGFSTPALAVLNCLPVALPEVSVAELALVAKDRGLSRAIQDDPWKVKALLRKRLCGHRNDVPSRRPVTIELPAGFQ